MKRTHKTLDVVVNTQVDYMLPEGKVYIKNAENLIVPGIQWMLTRTDLNSAGVLFVNNHFSEDEYAESEYAVEFPPHCLLAGLDDYEPVGTQNVFSQRLLVTRGVPVFNLQKKTKSMWGKIEGHNTPSVHLNRGGASTAMTLEYFMNAYITDDLGVSNVNIWGVDVEFEVAQAMAGFLKRGFRVTLHAGLCHLRGSAHAAQKKLASDFRMELESGQLQYTVPLGN
jgi:nicotinamidase/pyrazinamidase